MTDIQKRLEAYADFFEHLELEDLQRFEKIFSEDIHFKDPFNDVHGVPGIKQVFEHMFEQCDDPRFRVSDFCGKEDRGYLQWSFSFTPKGWEEACRLEGLSRVTFDEQGCVSEHIDYWDPAEQIYSRLPVLGWLFGVVRSRLSASGG
mgnify:CR=1 FL=1